MFFTHYHQKPQNAANTAHCGTPEGHEFIYMNWTEWIVKQVHCRVLEFKTQFKIGIVDLQRVVHSWPRR
jgi:hypothetical protein